MSVCPKSTYSRSINHDRYREVGVSSGNQALTRCAFDGTIPTDELTTSGLPVIQAQSRKGLLIGCQAGHFYA